MGNFGLYNVLGVDRNASQDEIKRAYKKLAMNYHPDKNKSEDAEKKFKEISIAYNVLGNEDEKQKYDMSGGDENYNSGGGGGMRNPHDIFEAIFRSHGCGSFEDDIFGGFGGFGRGGNSRK